MDARTAIALFGSLYDPAHWIPFGVGSSAFFRGGPGEELIFTLAGIDGAVVVLDCATDRTGGTCELGAPSRISIGKRAPGPALPDELQKWLRLHQPWLLKTLLPPFRQPAVSRPPPPPPSAEGREILEVDGEDRVCRWEERPIGPDFAEGRVKAWTAPGVPGGIVRVELQLPAGAPLSAWSLAGTQSV